MAVVLNDSGLCGDLRLHHFYRHDPSERSEPSTPRSSSGLQSRLFTPSVAFTVKDAARLSFPPTRGQAH